MMAESESNTDDSLQLPDFITSECEEFLKRFGPFDDVPDTVKEEYRADQTCLQNSQAAIHNVPCQDCLLELCLEQDVCQLCRKCCQMEQNIREETAAVLKEMTCFPQYNCVYNETVLRHF